eukprot:TRINITY_DN1629_c0_g1_i1.p1 TRINITY_DN1629_c0_g1~~TRINITY_DN1629_c0_g1_i1.p1  ORF type:complete len:348 (-),score=34.73 TRINITY_DN1629_c0_g1_i1:74-1117(-)
MDLSNDTQNELLYVAFNQDDGCFACGTENGFFICDTDPFKLRFRREFDDGGIGIVEMLYRCNILALVGGGKNPKYNRNKVMIWDDYQVKCIAELEFRSAVLGIKLRRDMIVVVLENKVYVYNFSDLKLLDQRDTFHNPRGLIALSSSSTSTVLVTLSEAVGEVIVDIDRKKKHVILAHTNPISQMALNNNGTLLATTSDRGTLIRVFDTHSGKKIQEFRRGAQQAVIQSISFSKDSSTICVSSDKGTIHLYSVKAFVEGDPKSSINKQSSFSFMKTLVSYYGSEWSFAQFSVPETRSICAFGSTVDTVIVLGASGTYYKFAYEKSQDGKGVICKQRGSPCRFIQDKE